MSVEHLITDDGNRKMRASIGGDGSVNVKKAWTTPDGRWHRIDMIINSDEWDRIQSLRPLIEMKSMPVEPEVSA